MDKEILRIVIIATGLVVIIGMLLWAYLKNKKSRRDLDFFSDNDTVSHIDESLKVHTDNDDFDIVPLGSAKHSSGGDKSKRYYGHHDDYEAPEAEEIEPPPRFVAPAIIQFSLVAKAEQGFKGTDLVNAFELVGLEYGNLKIFERVDANRLVDFGVACMVAPGTFPDKNLESFYCPGLVFFMQPGELDNAQAVFDDYIETIQLLATQLGGVVRDHQSQPLTDATIQLIRQSL
ncbi:Cell division protein ZipA [Candidatus Methylobacter favarea]|uniref:Cell division protein ZipA n=1 Tax=Candidatus Methylobacter favarea TaxID=2707345 RepID=A0A8S0X8Q2_9GAMM|nr:cell division protein ZipA C-terminal FtsZ-binding domain-containing protein [Candidatus Methylobacter favarea]CAA9891362.1 Cell division protein ZipA [Candidatus Methylobacter favarea]